MKRILFFFLTAMIICLVSSALAADPVPVESITLNATELSLQAQKNASVRATVSPFNASNKNLAWTSSDENVARVIDGRITAVKSGTATITATAQDGSGVSASLQVNVFSLVKKIVPDHTRLTLPPDATWSLFWEIEPVDADNRELTWTSSNEKVATVNQNGVIYARSKGNCTVTCTSTDGTRVRAAVNVQVKEHDIVINEPGDVDVEFETEPTSVNITITNAGKTTSKSTKRRFRTDNQCVSSPEDMVIRPEKPGSDIIRVEYVDSKKRVIKFETYTVFVAPSAMGEAVRLKADGEPEPMRFLDIPWDSTYPTVNEYLMKQGKSLKMLSQNNDYLRSMIDGEITFGNLTAFSAATNYTYTVGDRLWEVRNGLFRGDLYFDPEIPFETVMQTARSIYTLDQGQEIGDRDYTWTRGHVSVSLTWTKRYTRLELVWDGTDEEESGEPEELEEAKEAEEVEEPEEPNEPDEPEEPNEPDEPDEPEEADEDDEDDDEDEVEEADDEEDEDDEDFDDEE